MASTRLDGILRHLRRAVRPPEEHDTDARLLERFLRRRDEAAFESLVLRHGPMVLGVCRRVLGNEQDAEDAFQVCFLVLVRNAASVRKRGSLGSWLYGVAHRTALEARRAAARRRAKEREVVPRVETSAEDGGDLREVLDRELAALPERYREAVVLCDLEGKGRREAARELGCPEGTVASRLARGRSLLARRLARYGLATAAVAAGLSREASSAAVPAPLVSATVRAAALGAAAAGVSANVSSLLERVVRTMLVIKLRAVTGVLLVVGLLGAGAGWLCWSSPPSADQAAAAQPKATGSVATQAGGGDEADPEKLRQELEAVKADLRKALDRAAALEERLKEVERGEVLFRGKPAAYWIKALKDHDPSYRVQAVHALAGIGKVDRAILPALARALEDHEDDVIEFAAQELAGVGKPAVPYLIDALKRPGQRNRPAAMDALGAVGPDARAAVPALLEALKGGGQAEREAAAMALGRIGPGAKDAVPALVGLVRGSDPGDRMSAAVALGGIGPDAREAVPALVAMLKDQELPRGRVIAAIALGRIGPDAKAAVPVLLGVLRNPVAGAGELPQRAFEAIEKIDPETAAKVKRP